jgi:hypothetical protein
MKDRNLRFLGFVLLVALCLVFAGCGGGGESTIADISGHWKRASDGATVEINLAGEHGFVKIGDQTVEASVSGVKDEIVSLDVKTSSGQVEKWTLMKVWDDTGSSFTLAFRHNGTREVLTSADKG